MNRLAVRARRVGRCLCAGLALLCAALCACTPEAEIPAAPALSPAPTPAQSAISSPSVDAAQGAKEDYVLFINVGKADAALCALGGRFFLIDTGHKNSAEALLAAVAACGVEALDGVFLTHSHSDHTGGMKALVKQYDIGMVYVPAVSARKKDGTHKLEALAEKLALPCTALSAGDSVRAGDARFDVLGPRSFNAEDDNDNSLVLRLCVGETRVLFTGDMQFAEEETLLAAGTDLQADVLKVGNHGNPDATSDAFVAAVAPRLAVISTDRSVDEDSANPRVLAALADAQVLFTEDCARGVLLRFGPEGPALSCEN